MTGILKKTIITASDYSDENNWLKIPEVTKEVDTFYIYPTASVLINPPEGTPDVCDIDSEIMRSNAADYYKQQAAVFEVATNVFAPFYRQGNMVLPVSPTAWNRWMRRSGSARRATITETMRSGTEISKLMCKAESTAIFQIQ